MPVPEYVQTEQKDLIRETRSGALLQTNRDALKRNRAERIRLREQLRTASEVASLKRYVRELEAKIDKMANIVAASALIQQQ